MISNYPSENIFYKLLKEIINEYYNNYGIAIRLPLNRIIKDFSSLDSNQLKYATNEWTHVDFLLYNKLTKTPALAIEVDGASFHSPDKKQSQRDQMKNDIFAKYEIPLLRFNTKDYVNKNVILEMLKNQLH